MSNWFAKMSDWFTRAGNGDDLVVQSLLIFTMTLVMLRTGLNDPVGIAALIVQFGILVRVNYVHGSSAQEDEKMSGITRRQRP